MKGSHKYLGEGERWPYSTGAGAEKDQANAGPRKWSIEVRADTIGEALEKIELYRDGIESSVHVWLAPIQSIKQIDR